MLMSMVSAEDLAKMQEKKHSTDFGIVLLLNEWEDLVNELTDLEVDLLQSKEKYQVLSDKVIEETDFKALYGKNNADIRKQHVKNEFPEDYGLIKDLEFQIDWTVRRISFLRELIRVKRVIMETKG